MKTENREIHSIVRDSRIFFLPLAKTDFGTVYADPKGLIDVADLGPSAQSQ